LTRQWRPNQLKGIDLLAGRKLLLADDSITIQKVVDLTFADEGVRVIAVNNGWEAVEKLDEIVPDVVLADVFMPEMTGYELCEYIKQTDRLKHIPVMLLVGSFEPFDEAEARRVGADDILTKPFQSIRKLIDKVGGLVGGQKAEDIPTAQLPKPEEVVSEPEKLSTAELELTTADTRQLPEEMASLVMEAKEGVSEPEAQEEPQPVNQTMEHSPTYSQDDGIAPNESDVLLELGDLSADETIEEEEFVLELDMDDQLEPEPVGAYASSSRTFVEPQIAEAQATSWQQTSLREDGLSGGYNTSPQVDRMAATQEFPRPGFSETTSEPVYERVTDEPVAVVAQPYQEVTGSPRKITLDQLSPEVIDAIAKRAVEMMSTKVVEEIAWEVVPQLSELLIKRQLEEKK
jgi:CheY-like chemotaxis protein